MSEAFRISDCVHTNFITSKKNIMSSSHTYYSRTQKNNDMMDIPNEALDREDISNRIKEILNTFEANINNIHFKKGIYIYYK